MSTEWSQTILIETLHRLEERMTVIAARLSPFDRIHDVVVVGSGHAGYAAVLAALAAGRV